MDSVTLSSKKKEIFQKIYDGISSAPPNAVIKLPAHTHIMIPGFTVKHPMTIMGRPGTIMEIQNGNIVVDFRKYEATKTDKLVISETSLIFKYELATIVENAKQLKGEEDNGLRYLKANPETNNTYTMPMIVVETGTQLEVRDCYMRSIRRDTPPPLHTIEDIKAVQELLKT